MLKIIDVTLRDGGCVNDFNFGQHNMEKILAALHESKVDIIELGYINEKLGSESGRTQFCSLQATNSLLTTKNPNTEYVAMIDFGTFNFANLPPRQPHSIDGIRLAFHQKNAADIAEIGEIIMQKGYKFFIQPMLTLHYSDFALLQLIDMVNQKLPTAAGFYIVDSFGEMRHNDVIRLLNIVDNNLNATMPIGFHSHNNLQMSYANAISVLEFRTKRDLYLDSSVMGMGKGAGNLNTELLLEHLNLYYNGNYEILPLLKIIDTVLNRIKSEFYWGYSAEYYVSSTQHCTPTYAQHFYKKHMLPIDEIAELLGEIAPDKKISFDKNYANALYKNYITKDVDDSESIAKLREIFANQTVLLIAPGKSSETEKAAILAYIQDNPQTIAVSIAHIYENVNYVFMSNRRRHIAFAEQKTAETPPLICTSNLHIAEDECTFIVNYKDYLCEDEPIESNAGMMSINLMCKLGVRKLILAGFDGFGYKMTANSLESDPVDMTQVDKNNNAIIRHIQQASENVNIKFLTQSIYDSEKQIRKLEKQ